MYLIAGLGNPGTEYAGTRHNMGFSVVTELSDRLSIPVKLREKKALIGKGFISGEKVILAMPQTYMNLSGESIRPLMDYYHIEPSHLIVVYDDIDLDIGKIRVREKGSAGTHNGMKDVIRMIGTNEFMRIRVGVGHKPERMDLKDFVLSRFHGEDLEAVRESVKLAADAAVMMVEDGNAVRAMNRVNGATK